MEADPSARIRVCVQTVSGSVLPGRKNPHPDPAKYSYSTGSIYFMHCKKKRRRKIVQSIKTKNTKRTTILVTLVLILDDNSDHVAHA